jgi:hypothetical protein
MLGFTMFRIFRLIVVPKAMFLLIGMRMVAGIDGVASSFPENNSQLMRLSDII